MNTDKGKLITMYRTLIRIRAFEDRVTHEFRAGNIGGHICLYTGEEAIATGACASLRTDDYVKKGMSMTGGYYLVQSAFRLHIDSCLSHELHGLRADDMEPHNFTWAYISNYLDKAVMLFSNSRFDICRLREFTHTYIQPYFFSFLLRYTSGSYLRGCINAARHYPIIHHYCKSVAFSAATIPSSIDK